MRARFTRVARLSVSTTKAAADSAAIAPAQSPPRGVSDAYSAVLGATRRTRPQGGAEAHALPSSAVTDVDLEPGNTNDDTLVTLRWADGTRGQFHLCWLRHFCRCSSCYHDVARERLVDTEDVADSSAREVTVDDGALVISWDSDDGHKSRFAGQWLRAHCYSLLPGEEPACDAPIRTLDRAGHLELDGVGNRATPTLLPWGSELAESLPTFPFDGLLHDDDALRSWMEQLWAFGFSVVKHAPTVPGHAAALAKRVSFLRPTFWGSTFQVASVPNPANLSLTGHALTCHTDFSWSEIPPGFQFLHCLEFEENGPNADLCGGDVGGDSLMVDGLQLARSLWLRDREAFDILSRTPLPFYFRSEQQAFLHHGCVIELESAPSLSATAPPELEDGMPAVRAVRFNQANLAPLHLPVAEDVPRVLRAVRSFVRTMRSPKVELKFKLEPGDILVFNNRRTLHGRSAYDPLRVTRRLEGCYLDLEEFHSRYWSLTATQSTSHNA